MEIANGECVKHVFDDEAQQIIVNDGNKKQRKKYTRKKDLDYPKKTETVEKKKLKYNASSWRDIFAVIKLVVSIDMTNEENPFLTIIYASESFYQNFEYSKQPSILFSDLSGRATSRMSIFRIEKAILSGLQFISCLNELLSIT